MASSLFKRIKKTKLKVETLSYPLPISTYWIFFGIFLVFYYPFEHEVAFNLGKVTLFSFLLWIRISVVVRIFLTMILKHKGYVLETRGQEPTTKTKVFSKIITALIRWNPPNLFSFENCLPRLPVPDLNDTITRYLSSIQPLVNAEKFERIKQESEEFKNGMGKKIHRSLMFKSWFAENYVSDWWESAHYLKSRSPLMYGTSIYITDNINSVTNNQAARAANLIFLMMRFREKILSQELDVIYTRNIIPICMWQYRRLFSTTRVPGVDSDKIVHLEDSRHVVVMHKGCFYKINVYHGEELYNSAELQSQIEEILQSKPSNLSTEKHLAALTAWNRTKWAEVRNEFFSSGVNKDSLSVIESAAFVLALDDEPYIYDLKSSAEEYGKYGRQLLVGNGCNRWFDKSFNLCVSSNGRAGLHNDHSWGDGSFTAHFFQECIIDDHHCYDVDGKLKVKQRIKATTIVNKLEWDVSSHKLKAAVEAAYNYSQSIVLNVDHQIKLHESFGTGLMKELKVSPDAFIQMSIQLAYYRQHNKFSLTYEPAMTRLFRKGRTETIRPCTNESTAFVLAMTDESSNNAQRLELFRKACAKHQQMYLDAMYGQGVDRHLFALRVAAQEAGVKCNFLDEAVSEPFMMLTSHIPHGQTPKTSHKNNEFYVSAGGAMPPGTHNGYSISYFPFNDDLLFLHVSSLKNVKSTDTTTLLNGIITALRDIKDLFQDHP